MIRAIWLFVLAGICIAQSAAAHTRSQSFSTWNVDGSSADFVFAVDALRITQLGVLYPEKKDMSEIVLEHVRESLSAVQGETVCDLALKPPSISQSVYRISGRFSCPENITQTPTDVEINAFFAVSPTHIHLARLSETLGGDDIILRQRQSGFELQPDKKRNTLLGFMGVGFFHVLSGLDHLVFLIGLAFVARKPRLAVLCITGFTLGHTASLGFATYGLISPDSRLVEALIGFTIAIMALEAAAKNGNRRLAFLAFAILALAVSFAPLSGQGTWLFGLCLAVYVGASGFIPEGPARKTLPLLTIAFGLIHGAGFAGGLQELSLSQANLAKPLIGFNIGVELAQLLALAIIYVLMFGLGKYAPKVRMPVETLAALVIFGLGCFWFASRLWG